MATGSVSVATQIPDDPTLHVSVIDISLARSSMKSIKFIRLYKNAELLRTVQKILRSGESHREEFRQPLTMVPSDQIRASVGSLFNRVNIDISFRDIQSMRTEGGEIFYRKKIRDIEVVISAHQHLSAVTTQILEDCPRFRLLIIGNSGVGKSSLIHKVFGAPGVPSSQSSEAGIEREYTSPTNKRIVIHHSSGFEGSEAGDEDNVENVKGFVTERMQMSKLEDRLHAVWLCLEIPLAGDSLVETKTKSFLQRRSEILSDIPLVVVLIDLLDEHLVVDLPDNETLENLKSEFVNEYLINPLHNVAGNDMTHLMNDCATSIPAVLKVTKDNMEKYHVNEGPCIAASIAQHISIEEKISLSITVGKKRYWNTLLRSAVFRGQALKECLQVIREDIITIWNFNDPDQCLMDDRIVGALLRNDLGDTVDVYTSASFSTLLESSFEMVKNVSGSGDVTLGILGGVARMSISIPEKVYQDDSHAKDAKILMAYIVDLICVMQIIFLSISDDRVTPDAVAFALQAYEEPRKIVHQRVAEFDAESGVPHGGRDYALEEIEDLIWQYSIKDHEIERLRQKMRQVVLVPFLRYQRR